jgi:hypothetical protein
MALNMTGDLTPGILVYHTAATTPPGWGFRWRGDFARDLDLAGQFRETLEILLRFFPFISLPWPFTLQRVDFI